MGRDHGRCVMSFGMDLHRSSSGMIYNRAGGVDWPVCNPSQPTTPEPPIEPTGGGASDHPFAVILVLSLIAGFAAGPPAGLAVFAGLIGLAVALAVAGALLRLIGWAISQVFIGVVRLVTWPIRGLWRLVTC